MRRQLLERFLPIPYLDDWRVRADDCLVFGSSVAGGRKYFLARPLVNYRLHACNHFAGRRYDTIRDYQHKLAVNRLMQWLVSRMGYDVRRLPEFSHREFCTIGKPALSKLWKYLQLAVRSEVSLVRKLGITATMLRHYCTASRAQCPSSRAQCPSGSASTHSVPHAAKSGGAQRQSAAASVCKPAEMLAAVTETRFSKL